jgi:predicted alpha/beta superfamily hydrolase
VLYLQDGQNLFGAETAFAGVSWGVGETAQRLIDAGRMVPVILVGIDNAGGERTDEYTPVAWRGRGGQGQDFARMLIERIKPFVDQHYRTLPGRESTAIGGSSLGGLFSLWLALQRPEVFGTVMAMSPSVWWGNGHLVRLVADLPERLPIRIWLDVGKQEVARMRQGTRALAEQLLAKGWQKHRTARLASLRHVEVPRSRHDEASWGRRLDRALPFLFPPPPKRRSRKVNARSARR